MSFDDLMVIARLILSIILTICMYVSAEKRNTAYTVFWGIGYLAVKLEGKANHIIDHLEVISNLLK